MFKTYMDGLKTPGPVASIPELVLTDPEAGRRSVTKPNCPGLVTAELDTTVWTS